ncbi:MAG: methyltransferase domain-containing protein [Candidatus Rokubacteria bacterium]|nr:methyltransferase domain-containing protein [Candidatus Rokubacteria bacterium]
MRLQGEGVSPSFLALLDAEPLEGLTALDVGTGWGRVALALAARCRAVVGVDRSPDLIEDARRRAAAAGLTNVRFEVGDVETEEYDRWAVPDVVTAHLCMSGGIAERAARTLAAGGVFAAVAFHAEQWAETGRRSRFAYDEPQMRALLERTGFEAEHLSVEREVRTFGSVEEALAAVLGLEERWKVDGRWFRYVKYLEEGGRSLTRSHLMVKARRR